MRVLGLTDVTADFVKAASTVERRAGDATKEAAEDLADDARSFVPVLTGTLQGSIEVTQVKATVFEVGPTAPYGKYVEDGTSDTAPQPFMQPAADRQAPEYVKALEEVAEDI